MSDPVTNAEIEDVLSSIRRLVSENASSRRPAEPEGRALDKLVLTPAFRVSDSKAGPDATPDTEARRREPESDGPAEETGAEVAAAPRRASSLEERIAELEAAVGRSYGGFEPDGSAYDGQSSEAMVYEPAGVELGWGEGVWATDPNEESGEAGEASPDEAEEWEDSAREAEPQPDEVGADELAEIEARTGAGGIEDEAEDETGQARFYPDEAVLDEEALRELVSRLVREELQGSVGERITRNVRLLVRREIQRALSLRDFE